MPNIVIPEDTDIKLLEDQVVGATSLEPPTRTTKISENKKSSYTDLNESHDSLPGKMLEASELGLKCFTSKNNGWPKNFTTEDLVKLVRNNKTKWQYTNNKYSKEQILKKTQKGEINLSKCCYAVEPDEYRKIRSGLNQERSPLEHRDPRQRKFSNN